MSSINKKRKEISKCIIIHLVTHQANQKNKYRKAQSQYLPIENDADKNVINLGGNDYGISLYISPLDKVQALTTSKPIISDEQEKPTAIEFPEHIMLTHISRSLLKMIRTDGSSNYRFTFAYRIDNNGVIYASLNVPVEKVVLNDKNCRVTLGNYDTEYICELSDGGTVTLTAAEIDNLYRKNRERYIAKIKERRQKIHDMIGQ